jgi:hypothetical protein
LLFEEGSKAFASGPFLCSDYGLPDRQNVASFAGSDRRSPGKGAIKMFDFRVVAQRFVLLIVLAAGVAVAGLSNARAGSPDASPVGTWTIVIPVGFANNIFTWRVKADGTYEEDARDVKTGESVQPTFTGRWSVKDGRLTLAQNEYAYVFDGLLIGDSYSGMLTLAGREPDLPRGNKASQPRQPTVKAVKHRISCP